MRSALVLPMCLSPRVSQWTEIYRRGLRGASCQREGQGATGEGDRGVRQDHLPVLGQPEWALEGDSRGIRDHVPRDGGKRLCAQSAGGQGLADLVAGVTPQPPRSLSLSSNDRRRKMERASMLHLQASHDDNLVAFDSLGAMLDFCADSDHQAPVCAVTA